MAEGRFWVAEEDEERDSYCCHCYALTGRIQPNQEQIELEEVKEEVMLASSVP